MWARAIPGMVFRPGVLVYLTPPAQLEDNPFAARSRLQGVVAELDARGEIDPHAAMCLKNGIEAALAGNIKAIVVDLRDLTSIDAAGLALFVRARADCRAIGARLGLLISGRASHVPIAYAFASAGLGNQLDFTCEPPAPATPRAHGLRVRAASAQARFGLRRRPR